MIIVHKIEDIPPLSSPIALTIGMFDGVHLGHQSILQELKKYGTAVVFTFSNHPSEILRNHQPHLLCSPEKKVKLLKQNGIDCTIILPFTQEFANQPYDLFLKNLKKHLPFKFLILGKGAAFGHKNKGDEAHVKALESQLDFTAIYLEKQSCNGQPISSKKIRELILSEQYEQAAALLGYKKD